ncbi:MAG: class I SAM-dependent DNA methyltransferase [Vampirovibrio sp.]|nr:class I SAM-dependent DNA methyltransferase [Vampirovibrio sp.]
MALTSGVIFPKQLQQKDQLTTFAHWAKTHIKGDERADAQTFLNHFFQAFGYEGVHEAGGRFEVPTEKASLNDNKGFFDCLFKDVAIFEMKGKGKPLNNHYNQLQKYWMRCTPKPKLAILCNFDEFWIYDFNIQMDEPVQKLRLEDLAEKHDKLAFMNPESKRFSKINWDCNTEELTKDAVEDVKTFYDDIVKHNACKPKPDQLKPAEIEHFILQCMLCMFAEDINLMPARLFTDLIADCLENPEQSYDLIERLFQQMNNPKKATGGRFKGVDYFNGGLFKTIVPIELTVAQLTILYRMAEKDWRPVRPSIFGTILETMMTKGERKAGGVHYTSELDIYKIVTPTVVQYWDEQLASVDALKTPTAQAKRYFELLTELRAYRILDPACGSGNFLYVAFIELKRLEKALMEHYNAVEVDPNKHQHLSLVSPLQFYGMDVKPFAVELAKLTLEIGRKIAVDRFGLAENVLPLDNLDENITCGDALFTPWHPADAIIGNPPFIGGKRIRQELGDEKTEQLYKAFKEVKGQVDYCAFWFRKAQEHLAPRCGLVATNSVAQGVTREASLKYIERMGGVIHNAVSSQPWSGEAVVHVSLVNWVKQGIAIKQKMLDDQPVESINSTLKNEVDVTTAKRLKSNLKKSFEGCGLRGKGFIISEQLAQMWIKKDAKNRDVLKPMIDGNTLANRHLQLDWVIDFNDMPIEQASQYKLPFEHLKIYVKPVRETNNREAYRKYWWHLSEKRPGMRLALGKTMGYFVLPKVTKYTSFQYVDNCILPCEANMVVASDDFYTLGLLNSSLHRNWVKAQCSSLGAVGNIRYTNTTCFETFPFLWDAPEATKAKIRTIAQQLDAYRLEQMQALGIGITKLYNQFFEEPTSTLYKLHHQLDKAVCEEVYGWQYDAGRNYNEALFKLNQQLL